jgi:hypothetical protein
MEERPTERMEDKVLMHPQIRSPITAPPLRYAGQSLEEEINRIFDDKVNEYGFWVVSLTGLVMFEWLAWYFKMPRQPLLFSLLVLPIARYAAIRMWSYKRRIRNLKQGRDGERAIGQYMELLMERGYRVFHDIIGNHFNVGHVLIGPAGVFSIETKTISKPIDGPSDIVYDGEMVIINGFSPDRNPIVQAKAQANWLREFIKESTGKAVKVRPVVLYPGWFTGKHPKGAEVWVLNPKNLPAFLAHEDPSLSPEDVKLVSYHISRYVRAAASK